MNQTEPEHVFRGSERRGFLKRLAFPAPPCVSQAHSAPLWAGTECPRPPPTLYRALDGGGMRKRRRSIEASAEFEPGMKATL